MDKSNLIKLLEENGIPYEIVKGTKPTEEQIRTTKEFIQLIEEAHKAAANSTLIFGEDEL